MYFRIVHIDDVFNDTYLGGFLELKRAKSWLKWWIKNNRKKKKFQDGKLTGGKIIITDSESGKIVHEEILQEKNPTAN